jgi:DNA polymerase-3 subunit epsilon
MKPIIFFDIESTGTDPVKDRIISLCAVKVSDLFVFNEIGSLNILVNPTIPIPAEATAIHGISEETIKDKAIFGLLAPSIRAFFTGCDLAGFNITNFDVTMLWEEFYRARIDWDLSGVNMIDCGTIFKKKEPRTLAAAVQFYCGEQHDSAHEAKADVLATIKVMRGQMERYADLGSMDEKALHEFSFHEPRFDLAGKLTVDKDGEPVYAFGNSAGEKVKTNPGFARWMLSKDFPTQTKMVLRKYLNQIAA